MFRSGLLVAYAKSREDPSAMTGFEAATSLIGEKGQNSRSELLSTWIDERQLIVMNRSLLRKESGRPSTGMCLRCFRVMSEYM